MTGWVHLRPDGNLRAMGKMRDGFFGKIVNMRKRGNTSCAFFSRFWAIDCFDLDTEAEGVTGVWVVDRMPACPTERRPVAWRTIRRACSRGPGATSRGATR